MILAWGVGCVPLAVIGLTSWLWVMVVALFIVGVLFDGAQVVWGTLLQRRVPPSMLGRVSSLDFFVSLALMPISMAVAGPVGEAIGLAPDVGAGLRVDRPGRPGARARRLVEGDHVGADARIAGRAAGGDRGARHRHVHAPALDADGAVHPPP